MAGLVEYVGRQPEHGSGHDGDGEDAAFDAAVSGQRTSGGSHDGHALDAAARDATLGYLGGSTRRYSEA